MIDEKIKQKIDSMTKTEMATKWRFAPTGDPMLSGEAGAYFKKRMKELGGIDSQTSKNIGW